MSQLSRRLLVALCLSAAAVASRAQENAAAAPAAAVAPELTLEACVTRALQRNFDLEIGRFNPTIAFDDIDVARGFYEPQLSVTGTFGQSKSAATLPTTTDRFADVRVGVTQQLYSGTTLSASSQLNRTELNPTLALNPAYDADLTLSVRQSLLRGAGWAINRAPIERAKIGFDRAKLDFRAQVLSVIQSTENAYFLLAYAREQLAVRNFSLNLAQRLFDEAKTRRETGVATDLDVLQAEVGVANARRAVILAEQAVKDQQESLLSLIGQFELDAPVGTVRFSEISEATPVFASSLELAKRNQPDYLAAEAAIEQYKIDVKLARDAAKPDLSVGGAVGLNGNNRSARNAYGDAFDRETHSWQVDVAFTYPWGRGAERARQRQSLSVLNRETARLRQLEQSIELQVRSAVRSVETNLESVRIASLASSLSQRQYELEKAKFDAGLSTSRRVLEAQDDLETAKVAELQAKVDLHTSLTALHRVEGSSLQRYAVTLP